MHGSTTGTGIGGLVDLAPSTAGLTGSSGLKMLCDSERAHTHKLDNFNRTFLQPLKNKAWLGGRWSVPIAAFEAVVAAHQAFLRAVVAEFTKHDNASLVWVRWYRGIVRAVSVRGPRPCQPGLWYDNRTAKATAQQ